MNNIEKISNNIFTSSFKNITYIKAKYCDNINCISGREGVLIMKSNICKKCGSIVCQRCISKKLDKCSVCLSKNLNIQFKLKCETGWHNIELYICKRCDKLISCWDLDCRMNYKYSMGYWNVRIGAICKNCNVYDNLLDKFIKTINSK